MNTTLHTLLAEQHRNDLARTSKRTAGGGLFGWRRRSSARSWWIMGMWRHGSPAHGS